MEAAQVFVEKRDSGLLPTQLGFFLDGIPVVQGDLLDLATPSGWSRGRIYWNDDSHALFGRHSSGFISLSPTAELRWPIADEFAYRVEVDYAVSYAGFGNPCCLARMVENSIDRCAQEAAARALLHLRGEVRELDGASAEVVLASLRVTCVEPPVFARDVPSLYLNLASMGLHGWLIKATIVGDHETWRFTRRGIQALTGIIED